MKYDADAVKAALSQHGVAVNVITSVLSELTAQAKEEATAAAIERAQQGTNAVVHTVFLCYPAGVELPEPMTGWVVKAPEEFGYHDLVQRVCQAGCDFNSTRRGRKNPVQTLAEALEAVPRTISKRTYGVAVVTKEPVYCIPVVGTLPVDSNGMPEANPDCGATALDEAD